MTTQPVKIVIIGEDKTSGAFRSIDQGLKGIAGTATSIVGPAMKIGAKAVAGLSVAAVGAAVGMTAAITKMTADAAQIQGISSTFANLAKTIGTETTPALVGMREASRGMVSDADLMQAGNKFMAMGLANSAEEMNKLTEVATQLGSAMGEGPTESMENFALMMANQSIPRLDSFGISSGVVRERITELRDATEGMTREEAFMIAVMEQAEVTMARVGEQSGTVASSVSRIQASFENATLGIGTKFLPIAQEVMNTVAGLAERVLPAVAEYITSNFIPVFSALADTFRLVIDVASQLLSGLDLESTFSNLFDTIASGIEKVNSLLMAWSDTLAGITGEDIMEGLVRGIKNAQVELDTVLSDLASMHEETMSGISQSITDAQASLTSTLADISADYGEKMADVTATYEGKIGDINASIARASEDLSDRLASIAQRSADQRERIERSYAKAVRGINKSLARAKEDYADALADIQETMSDKLADINERFAQKQLDIQAKLKDAFEAFQEKQADIAEKYEDKKSKVTEDAVEERAALEKKMAESMSETERAALAEKIAALDEETAALLAELEEQEAAELAKLQKKYDKQQATLEKQLAREKAARDKALEDAEDAAEKQEEKLKKRHRRQVEDLEARLAEEHEKQARALADIEEQRGRDEANAQKSHNRKVADLSARLAEEKVKYDEQMADLAAQRVEEKQAALDKNTALLESLEGRLKSEEEAYAEQQDALKKRAEEEIALMEEQAAARTAALESYAAPIEAISDALASIQQIFSGEGGGLGALAGFIDEQLSDLADSITEWAEGPEGKAAGEAIGKGIVDGVISSIKFLMSGGEVASSFGASFIKIADQMAGFTSTMGTNIVMGIVNAIAEKLGIELSAPLTAGLQKGFETAFAMMNPASALRMVVKDTVKALKALVKVFKKPFEQIGKIVDFVLGELLKLWKKLFGNSELIDILVTFGRNLVRTFGGILEETKRKIDEKIEAWKKLIGEKLEAIKTLIGQKVEAWKKLIGEKLEAIKTLIGEKIELWKKLVGEKLEAIKTLIGQKIEAWKKLIGEKFEAIKTLIGEKIEAWKRLIGEKLEAIKTLIGNKIEAWKTLIGQKLEAIKTLIGEKIEAWKALIDQKLEAIKTLIGEKIEDWKKLVGEKLEAIKTLIGEKIEAWKTVIDEKLTGIGTVITDKFEEFKTNVGQKLEELKTLIGQKFDDVHTIVTEKLTALGQIPAQISDVLLGIGTAIISYIVQGIQDVGDFVSLVMDQFVIWFTDLKDRIVSSFQPALDVGKAIISQVTTGIANWTEGGKYFPGWLFDKIGSWLGQGISTFIDWFEAAKAVGAEILDQIKVGIEEAWTGFWKWFWDEFEKRFWDVPWNSPDIIGYAIIDGVVKGIEERGHLVDAAIADLMSDARLAINAGLSEAMTMAVPVSVTGIAAPGAAATMSGSPSFANTFNTNISSAIEEEEFYYRVQEAQRQAL